MENSDAGHATLKHRLAEELQRYAMVSLYLFVCFSVISLYEASQSNLSSTMSLSFGMALVKALVLGKFVLIGEALKTGSRIKAPTLLHRIAWRSLGMLIVLLVLKLVEELILGLVHGQGIASLVAEIGQRSWISLLAPLLLMLLILIPLLSAIELARALGPDALKKLLVGSRN